MSDELTRRRLLSTTTVAAAGVLAGCGGGGGDESGGGGDENGDTTTPTEEETAAETEDGAQAAVSEYLASTSNYDGEILDETGNETVTVEVGSSANGGNFGFAPAAIRVDSGTTVRWVWTGEGGQHNVVDEDGAYESELVADEGHEFEHTFEESGTSLYFCEPHKTLGMKGAVVVE